MTNFYFFLAIYMAFQGHATFGQRFNVSVMTPSGIYIGYMEDVSVDDRVVKLARYLGVPYAEPPVGQRRFKKPVMKAKLTEPMVTQSYGPECLQLQMTATVPPWSEDCLFLNVFVPETPASFPLAVMVFIHGGGYIVGASNIYDAEVLSARGNVIIVTLNYRLGALGFLNLGGGRESNFGLWDQHLALQWVNNNIKAFGGDANRVTIFGESAGAGSAIYQGLYPGNKGLFKRIIAESGSASSTWSETYDYIREAVHFAESLGCMYNNSDDVLSCLRSVSSDDINDMINNATQGGFRIPVPFAPSVDGDFIKVSPKTILNPNIDVDSAARIVFSSFDLLTGTNGAEGGGTVNPLYGVDDDPEMFLPNRTFFEESLVPSAIRTQSLDDVYGVTKEFLIQMFTNWSSPDDPYKIRQNFVQMHSDISFVFPCLQTLDVHSKLSNKSTYMYFFIAEPNVRMLPTASWIKTAVHGDELRYVFGKYIPFGEPINVSTALSDWEKQLSKGFMTMWSNFAKTGNPSIPNSVGMDWKPYSTADREYLEIGKLINESVNKKHLIADKYHFWNSLRPAVDHVIEGQCSSKSQGIEFIRLVNGTNYHSGRIEVFFNGLWQQVCTDTFDNADATVVCRMLKFKQPEFAKIYYESEFGKDSASFITDIKCSDQDSSLNQCASIYSTGICINNQAAGVDCCPSCDGSPQIVG